jgi:hypothetical protein
MAKSRFGRTDEYLSALATALRSATGLQQELLQAHFDAPRHTASDREHRLARGFNTGRDSIETPRRRALNCLPSSESKTQVNVSRS